MKFAHLMTTTLLLLAANAAVAETTLRIGIQDDPDVLDPHRSRTYSGRLVYTALCDKLVDISPDLTYVPQLATAWNWSEDGKTLTMTLRDGVTFHDGEVFDAAAVKFNLDRARTLPDSLRKSELSSVESVEVIDAKNRGDQGEATRRHADFPAVRPRRDDARAQSVSDRCRLETGVLRPLQIRPAGTTGPHRAGAFR